MNCFTVTPLTMHEKSALKANSGVISYNRRPLKNYVDFKIFWNEVKIIGFNHSIKFLNFLIPTSKSRLKVDKKRKKKKDMLSITTNDNLSTIDA